MIYKYPICVVFHSFCKIARFFATEPVTNQFESLILDQRFKDQLITDQ